MIICGLGKSTCLVMLCTCDITSLSCLSKRKLLLISKNSSTHAYQEGHLYCKPTSCDLYYSVNICSPWCVGRSKAYKSVFSPRDALLANTHLNEAFQCCVDAAWRIDLASWKVSNSLLRHQDVQQVAGIKTITPKQTLRYNCCATMPFYVYIFISTIF